MVKIWLIGLISALLIFGITTIIQNTYGQTVDNQTENLISEPMRKLLKDVKQIEEWLDMDIFDVRYSCTDPTELMKEGVFDSCIKVIESLKMHISEAINQSRTDIDKIKGAAYSQ